MIVSSLIRIDILLLITYLGSLPMVGEIMNSARGATNVFSGATHHVNGAVQYRQTCLFSHCPFSLALF